MSIIYRTRSKDILIPVELFQTYLDKIVVLNRLQKYSEIKVGDKLERKSLCVSLMEALA